MDDESDDNQTVADEDYYAFLNLGKTVSKGLECRGEDIRDNRILTSLWEISG